MQVKNVNIQSMHEMLRKIDHEVRNSVSAQVSHMRDPDITRLISYIDELEGYQAHVQSQDPVDWPHAANLNFPLVPIEEVPASENTSIKEVLTLIMVMDTELCKSQSKDLPAGLIQFDDLRMTANLNYLRSLVSFIQANTPTDRPESAASEQ